MELPVLALLPRPDRFSGVRPRGGGEGGPRLSRCSLPQARPLLGGSARPEGPPRGGGEPLCK